MRSKIFAARRKPIERIVVVVAVLKRYLDAAIRQPSCDAIMEDYAAQRAYVHTSGRALRVIDDVARLGPSLQHLVGKKVNPHDVPLRPRTDGRASSTTT
jgi:hypothetical protein